MSMKKALFAALGGADVTNSKSLKIDGINQYAEDGSDASLRFNYNNPFSFSLWVKFDIVTGEKFILSTQVNDGTTFKGYLIGRNVDKIFFMIRESFTAARLIDVRTQNAFSAGVWRHVACTYDGSLAAVGAKIYVDSVLQANVSVSDTLVGTITYAAPFTIAAIDGALGFLDGNIDEVSAYDIELSQAQINSIYNSGVPNDITKLGFGANLIESWRMGDGDTAPTIIGKIGSNNLTMINSPTFELDVP